MFKRIVLFALIFAMTCAVWAARPNASGSGRRNGASRSGRRSAAPLVVPQTTHPVPAHPVSTLDGKVIAVTAKTITFKRAKSGRYDDLVMDRDTTTTSMILADDVTVRALKQIALEDIESPTPAIVQPADSRFSLQTGIINVKGIYIQEKGAPAAGGSLLTGILNTDTTTPTLQMGALLVKLRMNPRSGVFQQEEVKIDRVKPDQIVRLGIKSVGNKQVVSSVGIGTDLTPRKSSDSKNAPPTISIGKRLTPPAKIPLVTSTPTATK